MNGLADVDRIASHLDREADLADQVAGMGADDAAAEEAMVRLVEQQLGEAFVAPVGDGPAGGRPGKYGLAVLDPLRPALVFRQARPGDFRIGVGDRWNLPCLEQGVPA